MCLTHNLFSSPIVTFSKGYRLRFFLKICCFTQLAITRVRKIQFQKEKLQNWSYYAGIQSSNSKLNFHRHGQSKWGRHESRSPIKQDVKNMSNWLTGCLSIPSQKTQPSPGFLDGSLRQSRLESSAQYYSFTLIQTHSF